MTDSDTPRLADLIAKAGRIYSMDVARSTFRSVAVRDGWIRGGVRGAGWVGRLASSGTAVMDDAELTLLPAFFDVHEHLLDAARNLGRVGLEDARSIGERWR